MRFRVFGRQSSARMARFGQLLQEVLVRHGWEPVKEGEDEAVKLVLHFFDADAPRPYRRKAQATFVVGVVEFSRPPANVLAAAYPLLVRSLSNLLIVLTVEENRPDTYFVTLEQGCYPIGECPDPEVYMERVWARLAPLATAQLVIDNRFEPDLPPELWEGDERTAALREAGRRLAEWDVLPAPFPLEELLDPRDLRHVKRLFGIGGLSYGNLSARRDETTFWMSASGVNKADLREIGRDILLVKGYDEAANAIVLSVPPHIEPRRVSVDAIEHWMIYQENPEVGAIVHVHAWMEGIPSTEINYPCGTRELAQEVARCIRRAPDPSRAVVGLKNHGITVTGPSLEDIFARLEGKLIRQVPMT
ncbi:MAG TPA: class II aldolase/adducin family protein [Calditerricola sp.]